MAEEIHKERRRTKWLALASSLCYLILLPANVTIVLLSLALLGPPNLGYITGMGVGYLYFALVVSIPLSMLLSIVLSWIQYGRHRYRACRILCALPLFVAGCVYFLSLALPLSVGFYMEMVWNLFNPP